ncbi:DNA polymerase nu-like [Oopsacas minuta]|uniref:DNA polymerase nu-like n=1 Tax=Oopsacas minuta TaxID=111878 RepID=A0AAV7JDX3_9METZ|nr:DNA polymerase nu-like [Oopsacas minuta]
MTSVNVFIVFIKKIELKKTSLNISKMLNPNMVREILFDWLQLDKKCGKSLYLTQKQRAKSTSEQVLESLKSTHPLPGLILQHRKLSKLLSFLQSLIPFIINPQKRLYPCWQQTGAATGRLSCNSPNLQGVPKKSIQVEGEDINIRSVFTSRKNYTLLSVDFRSIELRIVAFLSQEESLCSVFNRKQTESEIPEIQNGRDIFTELTTRWIGIPYDTVSITDRETTKRMVYGVIYGIGRDKLSEYLMVTPQEAQDRIDNFTNTFPKVKLFMNNVKKICHKYGYVTTLLRRKRFLPHVTAGNIQTRMYAERQAVNFVVQGLAADLCKVAMIKLCNRFSIETGLNTKLLVQIHDEILFEVADQQLQDTVDIVYEILENDRLLEGFVDFILPLEVKVLTGKSWGIMQEIVYKRKEMD